MSKSRNWCFTLNLFSQEELTRLSEPIDGIKYMVFQKEVGAQGTRHLQGYLELDNPRTMTSLKKLININTIHLEIRKGTQSQAIEYCTKLNTREANTEPITWGEKSNPIGVRKDSYSINVLSQERRAEIISGLRTKKIKLSDLDDFEFQDSGIRSVWRDLSTSMTGPARPELRVITIIGGTGIGKSFSVYSKYPEHTKWFGGNNGAWFGGDLNSEICLFDEFNGQIPLERMLKLLDWYPLQFEIKGGFNPAYWQIIFICSNTTPNLWYNDLLNDPHATDEMRMRRRAQLQALYRRLNYNGLDVVPSNPERYIYIPEITTYYTLEEARQFLADSLEQALK